MQFDFGCFHEVAVFSIEHDLTEVPEFKRSQTKDVTFRLFSVFIPPCIFQLARQYYGPQESKQLAQSDIH